MHGTFQKLPSSGTLIFEILETQNNLNDLNDLKVGHHVVSQCYHRSSKLVRFRYSEEQRIHRMIADCVTLLLPSKHVFNLMLKISFSLVSE